jgi:hypothetical protein
MANRWKGSWTSAQGNHCHPAPLGELEKQIAGENKADESWKATGLWSAANEKLLW